MPCRSNACLPGVVCVHAGRAWAQAPPAAQAPPPGFVRHIDQRRDALDPSGAVGACHRLKKGQ